MQNQTNREFEIAAITMDDGSKAREIGPEELLGMSTTPSSLSEQDERQGLPVMNFA